MSAAIPITLNPELPLDCIERVTCKKGFHSPAANALLLALLKSRQKARHRARCFDSHPANQNPLCFSAWRGCSDSPLLAMHPAPQAKPSLRHPLLRRRAPAHGCAGRSRHHGWLIATDLYARAAREAQRWGWILLVTFSCPLKRKLPARRSRVEALLFGRNSLEAVELKHSCGSKKRWVSLRSTHPTFVSYRPRRRSMKVLRQSIELSASQCHEKNARLVAGRR